MLAHPVVGVGTKASAVTHAGLRACLAVTGSVGLFALLIERAGLVPAVIASVVAASLGTAGMRLRDALLLSVCLATVVALLFVGLLGQPLALIAGF